MTGEPAGTVGVVGRRELGVLTDGHCIMSSSQPLMTRCPGRDELERSAAILGGVELVAVHKRAWGRTGGRRGEVRVGGKRAGTGAYGRSGSSDYTDTRGNGVSEELELGRLRARLELGRTGVVRGHGLAGLGEGDPVSGLKSPDVHAHIRRRRAMMCAEGVFRDGPKDTQRE